MKNEDKKKTTHKNISDFIRTTRGEMGVSQQELATMSGVRRSTIAMIEGGINNPSFKTVVNLTRALGYSLGDLEGLIRDYDVHA